jgi:hypothetical protein
MTTGIARVEVWTTSGNFDGYRVSVGQGTDARFIGFPAKGGPYAGAEERDRVHEKAIRCAKELCEGRMKDGRTFEAGDVDTWRSLDETRIVSRLEVAKTVERLILAIEGLLDAPAFQDAEVLVGDDVRAIEVAKAVVEAVRLEHPMSLVDRQCLAMETILRVVQKAGRPGISRDDAFAQVPGSLSRETIDAMVLTLQSSRKIKFLRDRLVAV